jgi:acyl-CoA dehydrogenase
MTRNAKTSQQAHTVDELSAALADRGLDLEQLARRMRAVGRDSDAAGQIAGPPWRPEDVRVLNMTHTPPGLEREDIAATVKACLLSAVGSTIGADLIAEDTNLFDIGVDSMNVNYPALKGGA